MSTRNIIIAVVILVVLYLLYKNKQAIVANTGTPPGTNTGNDLTVISNIPNQTVLNPVPQNLGGNAGNVMIVPLIVQPQGHLYPVQQAPVMITTLTP